MANYFVDSVNGSDSNNGTTMDLAWATVKYALESGGLTDGDIVWVRRNVNESLSAVITMTYDGSATEPITITGWPRTTHSISSSDWTNGSTGVTVDDADMDREKHQGRYITGPDGNQYLITRVISSTSIVIDREYAGSTVSNDATAVISADENYATAQAIDDSAWTIKKTNWNGEADDLATLDFSGGDYYLHLNAAVYVFLANLNFIGGTITNYGCLRLTGGQFAFIRGCLFKVSSDNLAIYVNYNHNLYVIRVTIEGSGSGSSQRGISSVSLFLRDVAIYNMGDYGFYLADFAYLENVNSGVEISNGDSDIEGGAVSCIARDVKCGGGYAKISQYISSSSRTNRQPSGIFFENWDKELGKSFMVLTGFTIEAVDVVAGSGDPYKRTDGADKILQVDPNYLGQSERVFMDEGQEIFCHEFEVDTSSKSYRYYVQTTTDDLEATELWLEVEYVASYDDETEYVYTRAFSDETITTRSDASDWSNYLEVTGIAPAVASKVRIRMFIRYYHGSNLINVDPLPEIS